jgi:hypothetical protein
MNRNRTWLISGASQGLVTIVAPGAFRTNFLNPGSVVLAEHPIAEYQSVREIRKQYQQWDGTQPGN